MVSNYKIFIKGMVCDRCILTVRELLKDLRVPVIDVSLGEITTVSSLKKTDIIAIQKGLGPLGFTLLEEKNTKLVRIIKGLVETVYSGNYDFPMDFRFSDIVVNTLHKDYNTVSTTFSEMEGITLEKYILSYRIEKAKELLVYTNDTQSDISYKLGFSSTAHLSRQFKAYSGFTPSHFKDIRQSKFLLTHKTDV